MFSHLIFNLILTFNLIFNVIYDRYSNFIDEKIQVEKYINLPKTSTKGNANIWTQVVWLPDHTIIRLILVEESSVDHGFI